MSAPDGDLGMTTEKRNPPPKTRGGAPAKTDSTACILWLLFVLLFPLAIQAQSPELSKTVQEFIRVQSVRVVLEHVRIIDGTGAPAVEDQNIVIAAGKIAAVQKGADVPPAEDTTVLDLRGYTSYPASWGCTITSFTSRGRIWIASGTLKSHWPCRK